jgi:hypothetical protein
MGQKYKMGAARKASGVTQKVTHYAAILRDHASAVATFFPEGRARLLGCGTAVRRIIAIPERRTDFRFAR